MRAAAKLVAFDLDGTLVDSAPDLADAVDLALEATGLPAAGEQLTRTWIGGGVEILVTRALEHAIGAAPDHALFEKAFAVFSECYLESVFVRSVVYPGVADTLDALNSRGHGLCCITNKRLCYTERLLDRAGIRTQFALVFGGDSFSEKKPHPRQLLAAAERLGTIGERAVMVGDSSTDRDAARAANFSFVWVTYGYGTVEPMPGERIVGIDSFSELKELL